MTIQTLMHDNQITKQRTAHQNGRQVCAWSKAEIDAMHEESPCTVNAWGSYFGNKPRPALLPLPANA